MHARLARLGLLLAAGCGGESEEEVAAAMERALREAHVALVGALVADEALIHAHETPDDQLRHGTSACGCPCTERTGSPPSTFVMTLDFHDASCVPDSGLVPATLSGRAVLTVVGDEVDATPDAMVLAFEHEVTGRVQGTVAPSTLEVAAEGPLTLGEHALELDLRVDNRDRVGLGGEVRVDGAVVRFEGVELPRDHIGRPCPSPTVGTVHVTRADEEEVVVDLETPGEGSITVTRDERVSEAVPWCAFDTDLL